MPKNRARGLHAIAVSALVVSCGRSGGCWTGETTYEHLDGKVRLELVRESHTSELRVVRSFFVRVQTDPAFNEPVDCDRVDLAEDSEGRFAAFRCKTGKDGAWTVLRLRGGSRRVRDCNAPVGTGKKPDFSRLAKLDATTATRILGDCQVNLTFGQPVGDRFVELVRSMREDAGSRAAVSFVVSSASRPWISLYIRGNTDDWWDSGFGALTPEERTEALASLCPLLEQAETPAAPYVRAVRHCPLEKQAIASAALSRLETGLRTAPRDAGVPADNDIGHAAFGWAAGLAVRGKPEEAGAVVCAAIPAVELGDVRSAIALAVLARSEAKCPAASALLSPPPCGEALDCDGGLCSRAELAADFDKWLGHALIVQSTGVRTVMPIPPDADRARLAIALAQGPLSRELTLRNVRRRYTLIPGEGPPCNTQLAEHVPCKQEEPVAAADICKAPADAQRLELEACDLHIDDVKKTLDSPRHVCDHADAPCKSSIGTGAQRTCCAGLACVAEKGTGTPADPYTGHRCRPASTAGDR